MRIRTFFVCITCLLLAVTLSAQNSKQIFPPVPITHSEQIFPNVVWNGFGSAQPFAETTVYLACDEGATATLSGGEAGVPGSLIVDNFIQVQVDQGGNSYEQNYCPLWSADVPNNCYSSSGDYYNHWGDAAESAFLGVPNVDIVVYPGHGLYTFRLMDWGGAVASSPVWLNTSCSIKDKVCHYDAGKRQYKTLMLGPNGIAAHIRQHPNDYPGACIQ